MDTIELDKKLKGAELTEISKKRDDIKLVFTNTTTNKIYTIHFKGYLFETPNSGFDKKVQYFSINKNLGFKAKTQLNRELRNPGEYEQIFIQMEGSDDDNKIELIGVTKDDTLELQE